MRTTSERIQIGGNRVGKQSVAASPPTGRAVVAPLAQPVGVGGASALSANVGEQLSMMKEEIKRSWMTVPIAAEWVESEAVTDTPANTSTALISPSDWRDVLKNSMDFLQEQERDAMQRVRSIWQEELRVLFDSPGANNNATQGSGTDSLKDDMLYRDLYQIFEHEVIRESGVDRDVSAYMIKPPEDDLRHTGLERLVSTTPIKEMRVRLEKYRNRLRMVRATLSDSMKDISAKEKAVHSKVMEDMVVYGSWGSVVLVQTARLIGVYKECRLRTLMELEQLKAKLVDERMASVSVALQSLKPEDSLVVDALVEDTGLMFGRHPDVLRLRRVAFGLESRARVLATRVQQERARLNLDTVETRSDAFMRLIGMMGELNDSQYCPADFDVQRRLDQLFRDQRFKEGRRICWLQEHVRDHEWAVDDVTAFVEQFVEELAQDYRLTDPKTPIETQDVFFKLMLSVSRSVFPLVADACFQVGEEDYSARDASHGMRRFALQRITLKDLQIPAEFCHRLSTDGVEIQPYARAVDLLDELALHTVPCDMLAVLQATVDALIEEARKRQFAATGRSDAAIGADAVLPLLQYALAKCNVSAPYQVRAFLDHFSNRFEKAGKFGYLMTSYSAALDALQHVMS